MVGVTGFEHATSWSRTKRSTKLSHTPEYIILKNCFANFIFSCFANAYALSPLQPTALPSLTNSLVNRRVAATQNSLLHPPPAAQGVFPQTEPHPEILNLKDLFCQFCFCLLCERLRALPVATNGSAVTRKLARQSPGCCHSKPLASSAPAAQGVFPQTEGTPKY